MISVIDIDFKEDLKNTALRKNLIYLTIYLHTLDTLYTLDMSEPNKKKVATDMLINFTIWSQPINCTIPNAKPTRCLYL